MPTHQDTTKSAKQHARDLFAWLDQIALDNDLPSSAFKVAYVIGQHINRQTGEAFPGSDRIAARIAMSQATVIEMVRKLDANGHLGVDPGRAGRGHANRYRMILKPQPAEVSGSPKPRPAEVLARPAKPQPSGVKPQPAELKPQPADMNHFNNHLNNHKERGFAARSADDVGESPALDDQTKRDSADAGRLASSKNGSKSNSFLEASGLNESARSRVSANGAASRPDIQPQQEETIVKFPVIPPLANPRKKFEELLRAYPEHKRGTDDENAFDAFELATTYKTFDQLLMGTLDIRFAANRGEDVPELIEFLVDNCGITTLAA